MRTLMLVLLPCSTATVCAKCLRAALALAGRAHEKETTC